MRLKQIRQSRVPAARAGQRPVLARNDPFNIFGRQRQQPLHIAAADCCKCILHNLDILLYAHRNLSISLTHDRHFIRTSSGTLTATLFRPPIQMAEKPPSTDNSTPFTKLESSEARNTAAAAISSGRPIFPRGIRDSNIRFASGVRTWSCIGVAVGPRRPPLTPVFLPFS